MPTAALRHCAEPGCNVLVEKGRCAAHIRDRWKPTPNRVAGRRLQRLRMDLWVKEQHCRQCKRLLLPSEMIRDHIVPMFEGGTDDESNLQPLCRACHDKKSQQEALRARRHT